MDGVNERLECKKSAFYTDGLEIPLFFVSTFTDTYLGLLFAYKVKAVIAAFFKDNQSGRVRTDIDDRGPPGHDSVTLLPAVFQI